MERANFDDIDTLMNIFEKARLIMAASGNRDQWPAGYPARSRIIEDISKGACHIVRGDDGLVHGTFYAALEDDPTYSVIVDGTWHYSGQYAVIHRIAQDGSLSGLLKFALDYVSTFSRYIRIDTHRDNSIMRHLLAKYGFEESGTIFTSSGSPRIAYERMS